MKTFRQKLGEIRETDKSNQDKLSRLTDLEFDREDRGSKPTLAPHAVASCPMQPWPRRGMPDIPDGPSRLALGPRDFEGQGREAFWDQTPEERFEALPKMLHDAGLNIASKVGMAYIGVASENKAFAKGWLAELDRVRPYAKKVDQKP
jgi:hypothetical protein